MAEDRKKGLGRGLSALLGEAAVAAAERPATGSQSGDLGGDLASTGLKMIAIQRLHPGKYQPRYAFSEDALKDLVSSVKEKGILQPILVRPSGSGFEIIAGERRWRAAQRADLMEVPVIVQDLTDREALEIALVENLQRQDLSILEEAKGYSRLMEEFAHTQEELARVVGKSRSHVANILRLLGLPDAVKKLLEDGALSASHARALLLAPDPVALAKIVVDRGLNVRQTEKLAADAKGIGKDGQNTSARPSPARAVEKDADLLALERDLAQSLGLRVSIVAHGGRGSVTLHYGSLEELDGILARLS